VAFHKFGWYTMSVFACLGDDVVRAISDYLDAARDKYAFASCERRLYKLLWLEAACGAGTPRATGSGSRAATDGCCSAAKCKIFDAVTATADFDASITATMSEVPIMQHVSVNGHLVAAVAPGPSLAGAELLLWHVPSRSIRRYALPGTAAASDCELRVSDNGSLAAVLDARSGTLHLYYVEEHQSKGNFVCIGEHHFKKHYLLEVTRFALTRCGRFVALYYGSSHRVRVFEYDASKRSEALEQRSSWLLAAHAHTDHELSEMCFGGGEAAQTELAFAFREIDGLRHCVAAYDVMLGRELRCAEISTSQHVRAVAASGALLAFADIETHGRSQSRRAQRSRCAIAVFEIQKNESSTITSSVEACDSRIVLSGFESVKLRRYEAIQRRCAVYERAVPSGDCTSRGKQRKLNQRALLNMTTERNRWVVRATSVPGTATRAESAAFDGGKAQSKCVPLLRSKNALLEENAAVSFSTDAHWALFVRFDDVRPCKEQPRSGAARQVLLSLQNIRL